MPPLAAETPQPGDSASSTHADDTLLGFLRRKLAGEALPSAAAAHFHDADIYAADPATLTAGYQPAPARKGEGCSWFFFTHVRPKSSSDSRKSRMVGGGAGTWHSERAPRAVLDGEGRCVGHGQYFSYKRKTGKNCCERTEWYMVEFSEGQEGDHERVHGGEPVLVLCKMYRAHSGSKSSSSSRSARKRKPTDEHVGQTSAPVKAKRRLFEVFESPAPTPAAASQVSSRVTIVTSGLYSRGEAAKSVLKASSHGKIGGTLDQDQASSHGKIGGTFYQDQASHGKIGGKMDHLIFWPEPEASLGMIDSTSDYLKFSSEPETSQHKTSITPPSLLMSEPDASHSKIGGTSDYLRFWPEPEASQGMIDGTLDYLKFSHEPEELQSKTSTTPPSLLSMFEPEELQSKTSTTPPSLLSMFEPEELQSKTSTTPPSLLSMFEPKVPAPQGEMATFDWDNQMAGGAPPAPAHCYGMTDFLMDDRYSSGFPPLRGRDVWFSDSWTGNESTTASCCRDLGGWLVGAPPTYDQSSTTRFPSTPNMCSIPSTTLLPPSLSSSSLYGGPSLWSC